RSCVMTWAGSFVDPLSGEAPVHSAPRTPSPEPVNSGRFEKPLLTGTRRLEITPVKVSGGACAVARRSLVSASPASSRASRARIARVAARLGRTVDMKASPTWPVSGLTAGRPGPRSIADRRELGQYGRD